MTKIVYLKCRKISYWFAWLSLTILNITVKSEILQLFLSVVPFRRDIIPLTITWKWCYQNKQNEEKLTRSLCHLENQENYFFKFHFTKDSGGNLSLGDRNKLGPQVTWYPKGCPGVYKHSPVISAHMKVINVSLLIKIIKKRKTWGETGKYRICHYCLWVPISDILQVHSSVYFCNRKYK